jgi:hypothetical protein
MVSKVYQIGRATVLKKVFNMDTDENTKDFKFPENAVVDLGDLRGL